MSDSATKPKITITYAKADSNYKNKLYTYLSPLLKQKRVSAIWSIEQIRAGEVWKEAIKNNIQNSDIIIPLVSSDFWADDNVQNEELPIIQQCYRDRKCKVLPIVIRHNVFWEGSWLSKLQALPLDKNEQLMPVSSWPDKDEAWVKIVQEINSLLPSNETTSSKDIETVVPSTATTKVTPESARPTSTANIPPNPSTKEMTVTYDNGYALLIGIKYQHWADEIDPLNGTLKDIEALEKHFTDSNKAAYKPENVIALTEEKATAKGILTAFDNLATKANADKDASVFIYYSGHGETNGTDYFLVPYNFDLEQWQNDKTFGKDQVVLSEQFTSKLAAIQSKKSLVILDCCHAENIPVGKSLEKSPSKFLAGFLDSLDTELENNTRTKNLSNSLNKGGGSIILTSCKAGEKSLDLGSNGLFTQVLLECLNGKDNIKKDGWVRFLDLRNYVQDEVPKRAASHYNHQQHPVFKEIKNLGAEAFIICAYDIKQAKGIRPNTNKPVEDNSNNPVTNNVNNMSTTIINTNFIRQQIAQNKITEAIKNYNQLAQKTNDNSTINAAISVSASNVGNEEEKHHNRITQSYYDMQKAKIKRSLSYSLDILDRDFPNIFIETNLEAPTLSTSTITKAPKPPTNYNELSGSQIQQLIEALVAAYPDYDKLKRFVRFKLDTRINAITSNSNLNDATYDLVEHFEAEGNLQKLAEALVADKPNNPKVLAFIASLF